MVTENTGNEISRPASSTKLSDGERPDSPVSSVASVASSQSRLRGLVSHFAWSVSSLPDMYNTAIDFDSSPTKKKIECSFCALCGTRFTSTIYRIKLSTNPKEPCMFIDAFCRSRLVAAGDFYTFARHLRRGLFCHRPIIDLYFELLHYRRNMFYARTGGEAFFIQSDFERLLKRRPERLVVVNERKTHLDALEEIVQDDIALNDLNVTLNDLEENIVQSP